MTAWQPIATAPRDNKRPLYLARLNDQGEVQHLDFNGAWERESESWELPQVYFFWSSAYGNVEEPTHWAYQDGPPPAALAEEGAQACDCPRTHLPSCHLWGVAQPPPAPSCFPGPRCERPGCVDCAAPAAARTETPACPATAATPCPCPAGRGVLPDPRRDDLLRLEREAAPAQPAPQQGEVRGECRHLERGPHKRGSHSHCVGWRVQG